MFTPEMMRQAQEMMGKMSPEQMQHMTEMASSMDPNMIRNMGQNMGAGAMPSENDMKRAQEEMKSMTPDQLKSKMTDSARMMNGPSSPAFALKEEGNKLVREKEYAGGIEKYDEAISQLASSGTTDAVLLESCKLNTALCQLKLEKFAECVETCDDILAAAEKPVVKALFRRGVACCNLPERLHEGYVCLKRSNLLSPNDEAVEIEFKKQRERALELGLNLDAADKEAAKLVATDTTLKQIRATSSSSMPAGSNMPSPDAMKGILQDDNAMKHANSMMQGMSVEQLASMTGQPKEQCESMKDAMKQMQQNPEIMDQMTKMMQNMSADDMAKMMQMRGQGAPGSAGDEKGLGLPDAREMINNPDMVKTAETFMKSMSPEMLQSTMKSQGVDISEKQAKVATKVIPWIMALYRYFLHLKRLFFAYQRYVIAFIVLCIGLYFM